MNKARMKGFMGKLLVYLANLDMDYGRFCFHKLDPGGEVNHNRQIVSGAFRQFHAVDIGKYIE